MNRTYVRGKCNATLSTVAVHFFDDIILVAAGASCRSPVSGHVIPYRLILEPIVLDLVGPL